MTTDLDAPMARRIAHMLGNMLQSFASSTEQLVDVFPPDTDAASAAEVARIVRRSRAQMQELRLLIGALWDVIAAAEQSLVYQPAATNVTALTRQVATMLATQAHPVVFAEHTPALNAWVDPTRLLWMLHTLLRDALRRAQSQPIEPEIQVHVRRVGAQVVISIHDNGTAPSQTDRAADDMDFCHALLAHGGGMITTRTHRQGTTVAVQLLRKNPADRGVPYGALSDGCWSVQRCARFS